MCNSKLYWTFFLAFAINECISISAFASLLGISIEISSSAMGLKIYLIVSGIKKYKLIIKKKKKKNKVK